MINLKNIWIIQTGYSQLCGSICKGVHRYVQANKRPWKILRYNPNEKEVRTLNFLQWDEIDGAIIEPALEKGMASIARSSKIPIVLTNADQSIPAFPQVDANNYQAGKLAAEYFIGKGFRSFLYAETPYITERGRGFQKTLDSLGLNVQIFALGAISERSAAREKTIRKMVETAQQVPKPAALYCEYDRLAVDVISILQEHGLHVPNDVVVLGTENDILNCESAIPYVSSIKLPYKEVGYEAARILDTLLRGGTPPIEPIRLEPIAIVERQSTDILAVPDPHIQKAIGYIKKNACGSIKVNGVARAAGLSLRVLQNHFRNALGYTLQEEIRRIRINRAKKLLETTDLTMSDIAEQIGYTDKSYMGSAFRTLTGTTPGSYRKQFKT